MNEMQNVLAPAGVQAAHVHTLWWILLATCGAVFAAVAAALAWALWRTPRAVEASPVVRPDDTRSHQRVIVATAASTLLLLFLIVASVLTDRALAGLSLHDAVNVRVTANQWWWSLRYDAPQAGDMVTTANELHVPVGRPVILTLQSNDVIHSFWAPNLAGKKDLIPGRTAQLQFRVDRPGTYRGQCAEFCGYQHAFMAFEVVAHPPEAYEAWLAHQRAEALPPTDAVRTRGRDLFVTGTCAMCHAITGTAAGAQKGPDLTHLAARRTLAAGTLPNDAASLKRWIRDPQSVKPGANMPASNLSEAELDALVAYLRGLT